MSTGKSRNFVAVRLGKIRDALTLSWGELADQLEISRAMLDFLRNGKRQPSPKLLRKIEEAEQAAGLGRTGELGRMIIREEHAQYPQEDPPDHAQLRAVLKEVTALKEKIEAALKAGEGKKK